MFDRVQDNQKIELNQSFAEGSLKNSAAIASIEVWEIDQVVNYIDSLPSEGTVKGSILTRPSGFELFSDSLVQRRYDYRNQTYPDPSELPEWQRQTFGNCKEHVFDRALIARVGPAITGVLYCRWIKQLPFNPEKSYWSYNLSYVDIHADWRDRGIASSLLKALDQQTWLHDKIIRMTDFTQDGKKWLCKTVDRELKAERYILLPPNYCWVNLPVEVGIWDSPTVRGRSAMALGVTY